MCKLVPQFGRLGLTLAALFTLAVATVSAFEGKISYDIRDGREKMALTYAVKGEKLRIEAKEKGQATAASMIMDLPSRKMTALMHEEQMYMVLDIPQVTPAAAGMPSAETEAKVEETGRTEKILGYTCKEILVTSGREVTELWVTEELGQFLPMSNPMGGPPPQPKAWEKILGQKGFFPLKVTVRDGGKKETYTMVATAIDASAQPDALFAPPPGYTKFEMPQIPGMPGGFPMMPGARP